MSELLVGVVALALFFYWFRYNCRAILKTKSAPDRARRVAAANQLGFLDVAEQIGYAASLEDLNALNEWLMRDYLVLTSLLRYTAGVRAGGYTIEQRMLLLDFKLLAWWFSLTRRAMAPQARRSLEVRSRILIYLAIAMGERCAALSRA